MAYTVEWNPMLDSYEVKRTLAKLHVTFMTLGFMSVTQVLKVVVVSNDTVEVYAKNGQLYLYHASKEYHDRLEQVEARKM